MTMVHKDYWALTQWVRHYGAMVGPENLVIVAHGADPRIAEICPEASILTIPRNRLQGFDHWRGRLLNHFQQGLLETYDWVLRTDADELVFLDPTKWPSLEDLLEGQEAGALFALGMNLFEGQKETGDTENAPQMDAVFTGHYSKAWAARYPLGFRRHGIEVRARRLRSAPFVMPEGVYLAHLKYANRAALDEMNTTRMEVAKAPGKGKPGKAWHDAEAETERQFRKTRALPLWDWEDARSTAHAALQEPIRDEAINVIRCPSLRFEFRTKLPSWITLS